MWLLQGQYLRERKILPTPLIKIDMTIPLSKEAQRKFTKNFFFLYSNSNISNKKYIILCQSSHSRRDTPADVVIHQNTLQHGGSWDVTRLMYTPCQNGPMKKKVSHHSNVITRMQIELDVVEVEDLKSVIQIPNWIPTQCLIWQIKLPIALRKVSENCIMTKPIADAAILHI